MEEIDRLIWVLSRPTCSKINSLMQNVIGVQLSTSEQHLELNNSRKKRDNADIHTLINYLRPHIPFIGGHNELKNIATGVLSVGSVNVYEAKEIGNNIIQKMSGSSIEDFTARKKDQCILMTAKSNPGANKKSVNIDPNLLFQRIIVLLTSKKEEYGTLTDYFKYELSSYPLSLFDKNCVLRNANKSELAKEIAVMCIYDPGKEEISTTEQEELTFVLDGGWLLHRLSWTKQDSYIDLFSKYSDYVTKCYGKGTVVVFDGYNGPSTKDMAHQKRTKEVGREILFTNDMKINFTKEEFLSNQRNKQKFLIELGKLLDEKGIVVKHADGDADLKIVTTAMECAIAKNVVVVGEDTDFNFTDSLLQGI